MNDTPIKHVSDTAFMVAAWRAKEMDRPDALFRDPLAAKLSGEHGKKILAGLPKNAFLGGWTVVLRTHIIDDFIQRAIAEGIDTILNLGAGLDTRPYRMDLPASLRWVEVDYPHVIEMKDKALADDKPRCQLERFSIDLADISARNKFLDDMSARSNKILVLTEGVIPYLSESAVASLGADLHSRSSIRYWIADYFSQASYAYRRRTGMTKTLVNAPFLFQPEDYFGFFTKAGWKKKEIRYFADEAKKLNRPPPFPLQTRIIMTVARWILPSARRQALNKFAGYVLFEPIQ